MRGVARGRVTGDEAGMGVSSSKTRQSGSGSDVRPVMTWEALQGAISPQKKKRKKKKKEKKKEKKKKEKKKGSTLPLGNRRTASLSPKQLLLGDGRMMSELQKRFSTSS
ncbi:unnamed protein product [Leuciscus chuanchicus]